MASQLVYPNAGHLAIGLFVELGGSKRRRDEAPGPGPRERRRLAQDGRPPLTDKPLKISLPNRGPAVDADIRQSGRGDGLPEDDRGWRDPPGADACPTRRDLVLLCVTAFLRFYVSAFPTPQPRTSIM